MRQTPARTSIRCYDAVEGEPIEHKIMRIVQNNEPITDGAPLIYTERAEGIKPEYDIRTDRWDIAVDAMSAVSKSHLARRQQALEERKNKDKPTPEPAPTPPAGTTE